MNNSISITSRIQISIGKLCLCDPRAGEARGVFLQLCQCRDDEVGMTFQLTDRECGTVRTCDLKRIFQAMKYACATRNYVSTLPPFTSTRTRLLVCSCSSVPWKVRYMNIITFTDHFRHRHATMETAKDHARCRQHRLSACCAIQSHCRDVSRRSPYTGDGSHAGKSLLCAHELSEKCRYATTMTHRNTGSSLKYEILPNMTAYIHTCLHQ